MGVKKKRGMKNMKMQVKAKSTRTPFTAEEKQNFYANVKGSARVHRNRKKYHRPSAKRQGD